MSNIYSKMQKARCEFQEKPLKKSGHNKIENDYVVKNFGDVEIYDLTVHLMGTQKKDGKVFVPKFEVIL
ncbi:MAG: hypothetical protein J6D33_02215 [Turicibacter sp.]|nr:hypothetical protein [Turicibacter sp.]